MDMEDSSNGGDWAKDTKSGARLKEVENMKEEEMSNAEPDGPPNGFQFVLPFLDLSSRLNGERLNKALREALKDPLVWADLRIEGSTCKWLTNENLMKLVERADRHLKSLFLVDALGITDEALCRIFEFNPGLEIISVPGCTGLKVENLVSLVEAHSLRARAKGFPGIRQARLGGLYEILPEHLFRLRNALGISGLPQKEASASRHYYGSRHGHREATDKRPVDVELCPDCRNVGLIYDCARTSNKHDAKEDEDEYNDRHGNSCRSCCICIPRCEVCGICDDGEDPPADCICADFVCTHCWFALPKCNYCNRPSCPRHEEYHFPNGHDERCVVCHGYDDRKVELERFYDDIYSPYNDY